MLANDELIYNRKSEIDLHFVNDNSPTDTFTRRCGVQIKVDTWKGYDVGSARNHVTWKVMSCIRLEIYHSLCVNSLLKSL